MNEHTDAREPEEMNRVKSLTKQNAKLNISISSVGRNVRQKYSNFFASNEGKIHVNYLRVRTGGAKSEKNRVYSDVMMHDVYAYTQAKTHFAILPFFSHLSPMFDSFFVA